MTSEVMWSEFRWASANSQLANKNGQLRKKFNSENKRTGINRLERNSTDVENMYDFVTFP